MYPVTIDYCTCVTHNYYYYRAYYVQAYTESVGFVLTWLTASSSGIVSSSIAILVGALPAITDQH